MSDIISENIFEEELLDYDINYELVSVYLSISEEIKNIEPEHQYKIIKQVEYLYESEADTELGDFINDYVMILFTELYNEELHLEIQDLIDDSNLNEEMLICVGKDIESLIKEMKEAYHL